MSETPGGEDRKGLKIKNEKDHIFSRAAQSAGVFITRTMEAAVIKASAASYL